jgi:hypothetical protein
VGLSLALNDSISTPKRMVNGSSVHHDGAF